MSILRQVGHRGSDSALSIVVETLETTRRGSVRAGEGRLRIDEGQRRHVPGIGRRGDGRRRGQAISGEVRVVRPESSTLK